MDQLLVVAILALAAGLLIGWLLAARRSGRLAADLAVAQSKVADAELVARTRDAVERERNDAMRELAGLEAAPVEKATSGGPGLEAIDVMRQFWHAQGLL